MRIIAQILHLSNDIVLKFLLSLIIKLQEAFEDFWIHDVKHDEGNDDPKDHLDVSGKDHSEHRPMEDYLK